MTQLPEKECAECGRSFAKNPTYSLPQWERQLYCSRGCRAKGCAGRRAGFKMPEETKAKISAAMMGERNHRFGKKQSKATKAKRVEARKGKTSNECHWNWKGDIVTYQALHQWLNRNFPRTGKCDECGQKAKTQYANIKGHDYTRIREDYAELCVACHMIRDGRKRDDTSGRYMPG